MSDETDLLEELLGPGAGVYRIFGEGQQFGSIFEFDQLSPSEQNQLFNELAFQDMALENALALGAAKEAGLDYGGLFGAPIPTSIQPAAPAQTPEEKTLEEEKQTLIDIIKEAGGEVKDAVIEGTADFGNLVFQAITLGQGPRLEAVVPNILDIVRRGIGGTLVLGGGQTPATVVGTGKTGIGAGTKVGLPQPIGWVVDILKGGIPDFGGIVRSLPGTIGQNLPAILASAAAADYDLTPSDKETLVRLGAEPSILGEDKVGSDEAVLPQITDSATVASTDAEITRTALPLPDKEIVRTALPLADAEIVKVLEDLGGRPAVSGGYDEEVVKTTLPEEIVETTTTTGGGGAAGGGGGAGGFGTPTGGVETVSVEPGPLVDIPGFYDISSMSIIPDYIDELIEKNRQRQIRGAAEGGQVKRFDNGGTITTAQEYLDATSGNNPSVRNTLSNFVSENAPALLASAVGGLFGLLDSDEQQPSGYQGGIPDYTAQRSLLPGAFDQTGRRPGSMGRRYFTDVQYVPTGEGAVMQGVGLPALEDDTTTPVTTPVTTPTLFDTLGGQEGIANLLSAIFGNADTTPAATTSVTTPVATVPTGTTPTIEDEYKLDIAGDTGEIATTSVTPYGAIPVDQDYTQEERDIVAEAIASGETTIPRVAGRFGLSTADVIEELLRGGYQTPAQVVESLAVPGLDVPALIVELAAAGKTTPEEIVGYFGNNPEYPEYAGITTEDVSAYLKRAGVPGYAGGGMMQGQGYYLGGPTDGMADKIPATINNIEPARLSDGEFVIPADVVSHLGNGNSEAGAQQLYSMMDRVRTERTGTTKQGPRINPTNMMPA